MLIPTIIVAAVIAVIFVAIVVSEVRRYKSGKGCCSCNCKSCSMNCSSRSCGENK